MTRIVGVLIALLALCNSATAQHFPGYGQPGGVYIGQGPNIAPKWRSLAQDCTLSATGVITCTRTNNVPFGSFATQNFATPPAIGGTTPAAGSFTALAGTTLTVGGAITTGITGGGLQCLQVDNAGIVSGAGFVCGGGGGGGGVNQVTNSNGSLTITPTTGNVVASLNVANANTWSAAQTFGLGTMRLLGSSTGATTFTSANAGASNFTLTVPAVNGTMITSADSATVTNTMLANPAMTVNGTSCTLGAACTIAASAGAGTLTGTTLAANVVTSSLTSVGTLVGGATGAGFTINLTASTVSGVVVPANGGTGLATLTAHGVMLGEGTSTVAFAAIGTAGRFLVDQGAGVDPSFVAMSGDAVLAGNGGFTLATVNSAVGAVGSSTAIPVITLNAKGLATAATTAAVVAPAGTLTGTTLNATVVTSSLTSVGTLVGGATGAGFTVALGTSTVTGALPLANGGTNNATLTAALGGVVYSDASKLVLLAPTVTAGQCLLSGSSAAPTWGSCLGGAAVSSVSNADGTLTVSPTTGPVVASLALGHANVWTASQTFTNSLLKLLGSSTGATTFTSANAGASNFTVTIPALTGTLAMLEATQSFAGVNTFANSGLRLLGSSTGFTTFTSANAGVSSFTITVPAATGTLSLIGSANAFTGNNTYAGTSQWTGSLIVPTRVITAAGTIVVSATTDYLICVNQTVGAPIAVTLPVTPATGTTFLVKDCKGDAATNPITVGGNGANIDASSTYVLNAAYQSSAFTYNGSAWSLN